MRYKLEWLKVQYTYPSYFAVYLGATAPHGRYSMTFKSQMLRWHLVSGAALWYTKVPSGGCRRGSSYLGLQKWLICCLKLQGRGLSRLLTAIKNALRAKIICFLPLLWFNTCTEGTKKKTYRKKRKEKKVKRLNTCIPPGLNQELISNAGFNLSLNSLAKE